MARACFPNVSQFPTWETLFPVSGFCFKVQIMLTQETKLTYATRQGILTKIRACEHKQASVHLIFASNSSKAGQNFASTFKLDGTILYPSYRVRTRLENPCKPLNLKALKVLEFRFRSLKVLDFLLNKIENPVKTTVKTNVQESKA